MFCMAPSLTAIKGAARCVCDMPLHRGSKSHQTMSATDSVSVVSESASRTAAMLGLRTVQSKRNPYLCMCSCASTLMHWSMVAKMAEEPEANKRVSGMMA